MTDFCSNKQIFVFSSKINYQNNQDLKITKNFVIKIKKFGYYEIRHQNVIKMRFELWKRVIIKMLGKNKMKNT